MQKDFDGWNENKKKTDERNIPPLFHEREIWWCVLGINVGVEIDGKHELYMRPVVVVRKFNEHMMLVLPTTSKEKKGSKFYCKVFGENRKAYIACLSHFKSISSKRLSRKIGMIDQESYQRLLERIIAMTLDKL